MQKKLLAAAGFALAVTLASQAPAQASDAPWCAMPRGSGGAQICSFLNVEQCRAYLQGITGQCNPNYAAAYEAGYYGPPASAPLPPRHRTRYSYY